MSIGALTGGSTQMDQLIAAYQRTRKPELDALSSKKKTLETKKLFFNNLKTKVGKMNSSIDKFFRVKQDKTYDASFRETADKLVGAKTVKSSDENFVKATADNTAVLGNANIRVNQLASNDVFIGKQSLNATASGIQAGETTYKINVPNKSYKEGDPIENKFKQVEVKLTFDGTETNETAMKKIANAFNSKSDLNFSVSYIKDTSTTGRLTFTAKNTGEENKLDLSFFSAADSTNAGVNSLLGLDNISPDRTSINNDKKLASFKVADANQLNSKLQVNGIDVERSSNSISDLLPGTSLTLLKVHSEKDKDLNLSTELDKDKIADNIKSAIDSYNDVIKHLNSDKSIRRTDSAVGGLLNQIRGVAFSQIEPENSNADEETLKTTPRTLTDLGFKLSSDGTLSLDNKDKLNKILEADGGPERIAHFLNSEHGFFSKLNDVFSKLSDNNGILDEKRKSIDQQLESNKTRTTRLEERIDKATENLRKEYTNMLKLMNQANAQYNSMQGMFGGYGGGFGGGF